MITKTEIELYLILYSNESRHKSILEDIEDTLKLNNQYVHSEYFSRWIEKKRTYHKACLSKIYKRQSEIEEKGLQKEIKT